MDRKIFLILWRLLGSFHKRIYVLTAYIVFYELLKFVPALVLALAIDTMISWDPSQVPYMLFLIGTLFVASSIVSFLDVHLAYEASLIDFEAATSLLSQVAEKLLRLPIGYHEQFNTGRTVHTIHRGVDQLSELVFYIGREMIPTVVQLLLTTVILLWVGLIPGLVFLAFLPLFFAVIHRYGKRVQPLRKEYREQMTLAAGHIGERIMNIRTVQDYAVEERELDRHNIFLKNFVGLGKKRLDFFWRFFLVRDGLMNLARALIMGVGIYLVAESEMTPGTLVFFVTLTEKANLSLFRMSNVYDRAGDSMEGLSAIMQLFTEEETIREKPHAVSVSRFTGDVTFKDVTFAYGDGKKVLEHLSFTVPPKTMLAIIGRSGAGKSTIIKLLYRHYDTTTGSILIDGADIRDYRLREFRRQIALVPQDIEIFNASVLENVAFGSVNVGPRGEPTAPREDIERVAKIAYAHDFIQDFPEGYDTLVGERGVKLSGGQRQRIGIARALLLNPSILVFDEATSSLDTESEQLIQKAMREIAREYTMIVIAHRLSTIEHADNVLVLEDGAIAEMGTHEDLLKERGIYTRMRELQKLGEVRE